MRRINRRRFISFLGVSAVGASSGCSGLLSEQTDANPSEPEPTTTTHTEQPSPTETETAEPGQPYDAENIQEAGTLNLIPENPDADYAQSIIFNQYNGEIDIQLNLDQALNQRHYNNPVMSEPVVEGFYKNAHKESWRQQIHQQYIEAANGENILGLQEEIDWNLYQNGDNIDERIEESGIQDLWYKYEIANPDINGISSVHNGIKAAAYQGLDQEHGFQNFYWDHSSQAPNGGHGLIAATEQPTRNPSQTSQQQNYTIETDQGREQEIATVAESNYLNGDNTGAGADVEHPAEHDYNDRSKERFMYTQTAMEKWEADLDEHIGDIPESLYHTFTDEWFRNPESEPAFDYFDRMNAVAYIAEENGGTVHHTEDEIRYES